MSTKPPTMADIEPLLNKHVPDGAERARLREAFEERADSTLAKTVLNLWEQNDGLKKDERLYHYSKVGVPEAAHELLDQVYDGREVTVESVRDLAVTNGFQVDGGASKQPEPGDPDYVWSSPVERHMWEQENER